MARGHSRQRPGLALTTRRRSLHASAASGAPAESTQPWHVPDLPETLAAAHQRVSDMTQATLLARAEERLADLTTPRSKDAYLSPKFARHPLFAAAVALVAAGTPEGDPQVITTLLWRLRQLQSTHFQMFKQGGRDRARMTEMYGLKTFNTKHLPKRTQECVDALEDSIRRFSWYLDRRSHGKSDNMIDERASSLRESASWRATDQLVSQLLCAGGRHSLARDLAASVQGTGQLHPSQPSISELDEHAGVARANYTLGIDAAPHIQDLYGSDWERAQGKEQRLRYSLFRARDDELDDADGILRHPTPTEAHSADAALATAHGLLRHPERFTLSLPSEPGALCANVAVSADAFAELTDRLSSTSAWDGIVPFFRSYGELDSSGTPGPDERPYAYDLPQPQARHVYLGAAAKLRCSIQDSVVEVRFLWTVEESTLRADRTRHARVTKLLTETFGPVMAQHCAEEIDSWDSARCITTRGVGLGPPPVALPGREALLGADRCDHETGRWETTVLRRAGNAMPYRRLSCRRCLRTQITTIPMHRRSADQISDPEAYLRAYRAQAAYDGEYLPESITIQDLVARDHDLSVDPRDYASTPRRKHAGDRLQRRGFIRSRSVS